MLYKQSCYIHYYHTNRKAAYDKYIYWNGPFSLWFLGVDCVIATSKNLQNRPLEYCNIRGNISNSLSKCVISSPRNLLTGRTFIFIPISLRHYSDSDNIRMKNILAIRTRVSHRIWLNKIAPKWRTSLSVFSFCLLPFSTTHLLGCIILRYSTEYGQDDYRDYSPVV